MDPWTVAAVATSGVSAADSIISGGYAQREAQRQQQRYNKQNAEQQQRYNVENMLRQQGFNEREAQKSREWNSEVATMKRMSAAGLNPYALAGSKGGGGGGSTPATSGVPTAGIPSVSAPDMSGVGRNRVAAMEQVMQSTKVDSEIDLNKAAAEKARADADKARVDAGIVKGEDENVDSPARARLAAMKGEGELKAIEAFLKQWSMRNNDQADKNSLDVKKDPETGVLLGMWPNSYIGKKMAMELGEVASVTNKNNAAAELDTEKKRYYWQEMLNAMAHADADKMNAAAKQLEAEYRYGDKMNAKWWIENGGKALNAIGSLVP